MKNYVSMLLLISIMSTFNLLHTVGGSQTYNIEENPSGSKIKSGFSQQGFNKYLDYVMDEYRVKGEQIVAYYGNEMNRINQEANALLNKIRNSNATTEEINLLDQRSIDLTNQLNQLIQERNNKVNNLIAARDKRLAYLLDIYNKSQQE